MGLTSLTAALQILRPVVGALKSLRRQWARGIRTWALTKYCIQSLSTASSIRLYAAYWKTRNSKDWCLRMIWCSPFLWFFTLSRVRDLNSHVTLTSVWSSVTLNFRIYMLLNRNCLRALLLRMRRPKTTIFLQSLIPLRAITWTRGRLFRSHTSQRLMSAAYHFRLL